jgi:hypothetical protein
MVKKQSHATVPVIHTPLSYISPSNNVSVHPLVYEFEGFSAFTQLATYRQLIETGRYRASTDLVQHSVYRGAHITERSPLPVVWFGHIFSPIFKGSDFLKFFFILYCTLLHLLPPRFHCVGGFWDRTHDCCDFWHWQSGALTTRLDLIT